ncbi:MAG TPA: preprotein translocase subunit SecY [bacterium]|nr:preprotein translocase subunit SecY [bacterium]
MVLKNLSKILSNPEIKKKAIFTLAIIALYKLLSYVPVPGVNLAALDYIREFLAANQGIAFFSALMGGGLENFSIVLMGLSPYINAVIIVQLLTVVIPHLENLKKEGEQGQKKINNYTRWFTVPLAFAQSYGMILVMNTIVQSEIPLINTSDFWGTVLPAMIVITSGTLLLMWLGDMINERGLGNGTSMIIFAGVLSGVPQHIFGYITIGNYGLLAGLLLLTLAVIYIIIKFTEGYRKIPLIYTKTGRDEKSFFPIRVNQAGMVPIIFAISIITFPSLIGQVLANRGSGTGADIGQFLLEHFSMNNPGWAYIAIYFLLVLAFSFFYISITFNTEEVAENIQKRGGYIPAVRPGKETADFLARVSNHLNLYGGAFLALIAVFPYVATKVAVMAGIDMSGGGNIDFLISGAGLIIVVGVILDLVRRVDAEMKTHDYQRFF